MSTPVIWIFLPGFLAGVLYFTRRWPRFTVILGVCSALLFSWMAVKLPIDSLIIVGSRSFRIADTLNILGRQFVLTGADRSTLALIYLAAAFWFAGSFAARPGDLFIPAGLGIVALMVAALAVEPFLYAALLIEMAALLSVPILSRPGKPAGKGVLRFLIFQTLGTPFILFAGWVMTQGEANPENIAIAYRAALFLGIGFSFLLAIFPFHTWIPMTAEESHPYASAFVFFMLPGIVTLFGLTFFDRFLWLRSSAVVFSLLRLVGVIMAVTAGIWAAFQRNLARMLAYAVIVDIGMSILAVGAAGQQGFTPGEGGIFPAYTIFYALLLVRGLALGAWSLALSVFKRVSNDLSFHSVQGMGRRQPIAAALIVLAHFSMAGFPLLAGFPARLVLWEQVAQAAPLAGLWALLGCVGLLIGGLRSLAVLVMGPEESWGIHEDRLSLVFLILGVFLLIGLGLFPIL